MKFVLAIILTMLMATASVAQVTVPLGNITVTPPPPPSFTQQVTQPVDVTVTFNGLQYRGTGNLTGTLTFTVVGGGSATTAAITGATNQAGQSVQTAASGATLVIQGTGFGQFGTASIAGIPAQVLTWTPTQVTVKVPVAPAGSTGIGSIVLTPGSGTAVTSSFTFMITAGTVEVPGKPTWESPVIATSGSTEKDLTLDERYALIPIIPDPVPAPEFKPMALVYTATTADGKMTISGRSFGEQGSGRVEVNERRVPVLSWSDDEIIVFFIGMDLISEECSILVWHGVDDYYYGSVPLNGAVIDG